MMIWPLLFILGMMSAKAEQGGRNEKGEYRKEISQYGITWTFDKPVKSGQFITGDWWVIGPVTIVKVNPPPGPVVEDSSAFGINHWNDTSLKKDNRMRNGSMIVLRAGKKQGYDSRASSYEKESTISFPYKLNSGLSLISSISNTTLPVDHFSKDIMWDSEKQSQTVMKAAAVLTCLDQEPPLDAFRPPYAGKQKILFRLKDVRWELLPRLEPAGEVPSWKNMERYFQRPWLDHLMSWEQQELVPNENGPNYGREHARLVSLASLMLLLDENPSFPVRPNHSLLLNSFLSPTS